MVIPFLRSASTARAAATPSSASRINRFASSLSTLTSHVGASITSSSSSADSNTSSHNQTRNNTNNRWMHTSSTFVEGSSFRQPQQRSSLKFLGLDHNRRHFSTPSTPPPAAASPPAATPPSGLNNEMAIGIQDATKMYIRHGLGKRRLEEIAKGAGQGEFTLVFRWQRMMEAFLGTQVHVLAGLGYSPDEHGIALYNSHLATLLQSSDPTTQEKLRESGRDTWREVLCTAFGMDKEEIKDNELNIVDARNIMHKVSQRMQEPDILEIVAKRCAIESTAEKSATPQEEMVLKHSVVQDVLVNNVYLGTMPGSSNTLVSECGFGEGERGYVLLQCAMAEHQADPLVAQYVGTAMMRLLQSAGIDMSAMQQGATGGGGSGAASGSP